jgi:hypothetical protein
LFFSLGLSRQAGLLPRAQGAYLAEIQKSAYLELIIEEWHHAHFQQRESDILHLLFFWSDHVDMASFHLCNYCDGSMYHGASQPNPNQMNR